MPLDLILEELFSTLYMVLVSGLFTFFLGLPLGASMLLLKRGGPSFLYKFLSFVINFTRATPFAIFIIMVMPLTRLIIGTSIGTTASIVPLTLGAIPVFARQVQATLSSLSEKKFELAYVLGATTWQTISKILIPEALPSLVRDYTLTFVTLISYSALAGIIGGGGLGKLAIQYGYQRYDMPMMMITLFLLVGLVGASQYFGETLAAQIEKRRGLK